MSEANSISLSEILQQSISLIQRTIKQMLVIAGISASPGLLLAGVALVAFVIPNLTSGSAVEFIDLLGLPLIVIVGILGFFALLFMDTWGTLAGILLSESYYRGEEMEWREAFVAAKPYLSRAVFYQLAVWLLYAASAGIVIVFFIIAFVGSLGQTLLFLFVGICAGLLLGIGVFYLSIRWSLGLNIIALEDIDTFAAFSRSYSLITGNWWRTAGVVVLGGFAVNAVQTALSSAGSATMELMSYTASSPEMILGNQLIGSAAGIAVGFFFTMLIKPAYTTVMLLLYRRQDEPATEEPAEPQWE